MLPYPLRAACLSLSIQPFGFWWRPSFTHKKDLTEAARQDGAPIWWARWGWFEISYQRWV